jgi:hypothetical protein
MFARFVTRTPQGMTAGHVSHSRGNVMPIVPYYLGHPAHVWIAAMSRRSFAWQANNGCELVRSGILVQSAVGLVGAAMVVSAAVADDPDADLPALIDQTIAHLEPGLTL